MTTAEKQLIIAVEGTAAMGPHWPTIVSDYLDKIIRCFCGNELNGQKPNSTVELALVTFNTHGSYCGCLVQRSGWTRDVDNFLRWLSAVPFSGGGFNDVAIAEGLSEALMMFSISQIRNQSQQNVDFQRHCILIAASNPYPLTTPVFRPQMQNIEQNENVDAETIAKSFPQCLISLSVISPNQLPKLRAIYNAGKCNPRGNDPPVDSVKNPYYLVLPSENFMEARAALSRSGVPSLSSNQSPVKVDMAPVTSVSGPPPTSLPSVNGPIINRQSISVANMPPSTVKVEPSTVSSMVPGPTFPQIPSGVRAVSQGVSSPASQDMITNNDNVPDLKPVVSSVSKYVKVWEGNLSAQRRGHPVFITRLEAYRNATGSETLAANWPPTMQILKLISQDQMNYKQYVGKADFIVFRAMTQHGFLGQLQEKKLCAVIQLPSQTLVLSISEKAFRLIGMLLPGDMVVFKPQIPNPQQQQQQMMGPGMGRSQLVSQGQQATSQVPPTIPGGGFMN